MKMIAVVITMAVTGVCAYAGILEESAAKSGKDFGEFAIGGKSAQAMPFSGGTVSEVKKSAITAMPALSADMRRAVPKLSIEKESFLSRNSSRIKMAAAATTTLSAFLAPVVAGAMAFGPIGMALGILVGLVTGGIVMGTVHDMLM